MALTPTYHVMEMYNVHQDAKLLPLSLNSPEYTFNNEKLPALSASASVNEAGVTHISLVNIDLSRTHDVAISLSGKTFKNVTARILSSARVQDHNTFEKPRQIEPKSFSGARLKGNEVTLKIPPFSVVVLELQ